MKLTIEATPKADMAYTNHVYVHPTDRALLSPTPGPLKVSLLDKVWDCSASEEVLKGSITLSFLQRGHACAMLDCRADVAVFDASSMRVPSSMGFRVTQLGSGRNGSAVVEAKVETLLAEVKRVFDHQVLEEGQKLALKHDEKIALQLEVFGMGFPAREEDPVDAHEGHFESYRGRLEGDRTELMFVSSNRMDPPVQYTTGIVVRIVGGSNAKLLGQTAPDAKGEFDIKYAPSSSDASSAPHVQVGTEMVDGPMRVRITGIDSEGHVLRAVNVHREVSVQITDLRRGKEYTVGECPTNLDVGT